MAMREAFRVNDARKLDALAPRLKGHVLEPYAAYWQLRVRLDDAEPQAVRAFLADYKDTFVAERMRADWLKRLGKNQQWDVFEAERPQEGEKVASIDITGVFCTAATAI